MEKKIQIFTDGACSGNPGKGGYGIVMQFGNIKKELSAAYKHTTNNRMELLAVIIALQSIRDKNYTIDLYSDSKYVCDSINKGWLNGWIKKGFKDKKNPDLWKNCYAILQTLKVNFIWVKGHNGHPMNERCDQLAVAATQNGPWQIDAAYENLKSNNTPLL